MQNYFFKVTFQNKITGELKTVTHDNIQADSDLHAFKLVLESAFTALTLCHDNNYSVYQITNETE